MAKQTHKKHSTEPVGRPRREAYTGKEYPYQLRMSREDHEQWKRCAEAAGLTLSHWIRLNCAWACGATARVVRAEIRTTYPPGTSIGTAVVPSGHPIQAIRAAVDAGVDVRAAVDELLADDSPTGQLIAAEVARRVAAPR